jgi:hypothetical protein
METTPTTSVVNKASEKLISVSELFSKSFALSKNIFWKVIGMNLLPMFTYIPMALIAALFYLAYSFSSKLGSIASIAIYVILGILALAAIIIAVYAYLVAQVGTYLLIKNKDSDPKIWPTFKVARSQAISFFETNALASIFIFLWALLLIVPGIMMAIYYNFVAMIFIFEGLKNKAAMRRSKELVKGKWWPVFGRLFIFGFTIWLILAIPAMFIEEKSTADKIYSFVSDVISLIITPFALAYTYHIYKSLVELKNNNNSNN